MLVDLNTLQQNQRYRKSTAYIGGDVYGKNGKYLVPKRRIWLLLY